MWDSLSPLGPGCSGFEKKSSLLWTRVILLWGATGCWLLQQLDWYSPSTVARHAVEQCSTCDKSQESNKMDVSAEPCIQRREWSSRTIYGQRGNQEKEQGDSDFGRGKQALRSSQILSLCITTLLTFFFLKKHTPIIILFEQGQKGYPGPPGHPGDQVSELLICCFTLTVTSLLFCPEKPVSLLLLPCVNRIWPYILTFFFLFPHIRFSHRCIHFCQLINWHHLKKSLKMYALHFFKNKIVN